MDRALKGKTILDLTALQPKCLNVPAKKFRTAVTGATVRGVGSRGKWILMETSQGSVLLNLGMGGEILLVRQDAMPEKWRLSFAFDDGTALAVNFWWFGYVHYVAPGRLDRHVMTRKLGPDATTITKEQLAGMVAGKRGSVKGLLLDQTKMAGIGNAYVHDVLFMAHLHPLRRLQTLTPEEIGGLARAIQAGLLPSLERGGAYYEVDLFGRRGRFLREDMLIGYREGEACPACGATIQKIKTGSTSSFICPACQPAEGEGE
jgi:formamidopyrimidine-DNA glycosylase